MRLKRKKREEGISLLETIVALGLLGIIAVGLLSGLATTSTARVTADEHVSAKILAESAIDRGQALEKLENLIKLSNSLG